MRLLLVPPSVGLGRAQDIRRDAFWLQRRIAEEFGSSMDAGAAQQLSEKVFKTLEVLC
jgi:hypothetical protein